MGITLSYYGSSRPGKGAPVWSRNVSPEKAIFYQTAKRKDGRPIDTVADLSPKDESRKTVRTRGGISTEWLDNLRRQREAVAEERARVDAEQRDTDARLAAESRARIEAANYEIAKEQARRRGEPILPDVIQRDRLPFNRPNPIDLKTGKHVVQFGKEKTLEDILGLLPVDCLVAWRVNKTTHRFQVKTYTFATQQTSDWTDLADADGGILDPGVIP